jgi:DNA-binding PadR family transcriptional regulator
LYSTYSDVYWFNNTNANAEANTVPGDLSGHPEDIPGPAAVDTFVFRVGSRVERKETGIVGIRGSWRETEKHNTSEFYVYLDMVYSTELLKGTLKTIVLKLLADNKKMYGYEITQRVKELTQDKIQITEGALYPTLHSLEADGLVTAETEYIGKRVRKYYSLSLAGKTRVKEKVSELASFVQTMTLLLDLKPKAI